MADKIFFTTPYGEAVFPWLNRADTEYDSDGQYHVKVRVPIEEAAEFVAQMEAVRDEFWDTLTPKQQKTHTKVDCGELELDDEGEKTGNLLFKCKMRANVSYTNKQGQKESFSQSPELVDEDKNTLKESIWSGSVLRCRGEMVPYAMAAYKTVGVSLRLAGVQVRELVTGQQQGGFGDDGGTMPGAAR
jgi:hypothetical protein